MFFSENGAGRSPGQQFVFLVQNPFAWPFVLGLPGLLLYCFLKTARLLIIGEHFIIDKAAGYLLRNGIVKLKLESVSYLRVRRHEDADLDVDYRLSIVYAGEHELMIDRDWGREGITQLAEEIAGFLNKEIEFL